MSGHNKWSTIKHKKEKPTRSAARYSPRSAVRSPSPCAKAARIEYQQQIEGRRGKAKAANMPNENIQRSIKKASGEGDATQYKEITYEGYAPGGVAVIVELVTDNLNRTASECATSSTSAAAPWARPAA